MHQFDKLFKRNVQKVENNVAALTVIDRES